MQNEKLNKILIQIEVVDLAKLGDDLLKQGKSIEEVSRTLHQARCD